VSRLSSCKASPLTGSNTFDSVSLDQGLARLACWASVECLIKTSGLVAGKHMAFVSILIDPKMQNYNTEVV